MLRVAFFYGCFFPSRHMEDVQTAPAPRLIPWTFRSSNPWTSPRPFMGLDLWNKSILYFITSVWIYHIISNYISYYIILYHNLSYYIILNHIVIYIYTLLHLSRMQTQKAEQKQILHLHPIYIYTYILYMCNVQYTFIWICIPALERMLGIPFLPHTNCGKSTVGQSTSGGTLSV